MRRSTSCSRATAGSPLPDEAPGPADRTVPVGFARVAGWVERYDARHPDTVWAVDDGGVGARSPDGASATFTLPFESPDGTTDLAAVLRLLAKPRDVGVILVRRGGFAVAHVSGGRVLDSKVGQRHVQGRTKAGGWSQQRFARRRDNQAREAYEAAAGHVARILLPVAGRLSQLAVGGDRAGIQAVLEDRQLGPLQSLSRRWLGGLADPKRSVLEAAVELARSVEITVTDPLPR